MNIHEYQAKALLKEFGAPVSNGIAIFKSSEAKAAAKKLGGPLWVVKSQIHAGGRGKGKFKEKAAGEKGGVRLAKSIEEVEAFAKQMLGNTLVTVQTGPTGKQVNRLYIEDGSDIEKEFYLSMLVDRETGRVAYVVSTEGGMDIEAVAHDTPEKIKTFSVDPATGFMPHHGRTIAKTLGLTGALAKQAEVVAGILYKAFVAKDMAMLEINPLIVTKQGELKVLDAKVSFDSNALYRHADVVALRDLTEEDEKEIEASKYDLAYIALDGTIGCMVNGAGLAMATLDIIQLYGESPANFLDVGGGASEEKVTAAFKIITADPKVQGILVNIFGGIMKCDVIARGVLAAVKAVGLQVPLVVRLEGTNVEEGKKIIRESGLNVIPADDLDDAAQKIVNAVKGGGKAPAKAPKAPAKKPDAKKADAKKAGEQGGRQVDGVEDLARRLRPRRLRLRRLRPRPPLRKPPPRLLLLRRPPPRRLRPRPPLLQRPLPRRLRPRLPLLRRPLPRRLRPRLPLRRPLPRRRPPRPLRRARARSDIGLTRPPNRLARQSIHAVPGVFSAWRGSHSRTGGAAQRGAHPRIVIRGPSVAHSHRARLSQLAQES